MSTIRIEPPSRPGPSFLGDLEFECAGFVAPELVRIRMAFWREPFFSNLHQRTVVIWSEADGSVHHWMGDEVRSGAFTLPAGFEVRI